MAPTRGKMDYSPVPVMPTQDYFIYDGTFGPESDYNAHTHEWGQLICIQRGIISLDIGGELLFALPELGIWIPAEVVHSTYNHKVSMFIAFNLQREYNRLLPPYPCMIKLSRIFSAVMEDLYRRKTFVPSSAHDHHLFQVLLDQVTIAPSQPSYLPSTDDEVLRELLHALEDNPADDTPLAVWAKKLFTTERTLARRFKKNLGMPFVEWRQRLRFMHSLSLLDQGMPVGEVAFAVGYQSASAFIVMFQQIAGISPERYRLGLNKNKLPANQVNFELGKSKLPANQIN
ncbi:MAG: helix-turn-helix transcriptional regulator [Deltaproteobacteria bacterium]|jgi:AraC-like DNA-binding protein|nr:helix-turn-helix transcriptional regulator [Deltaproteobacteria bacterium]